MRSIRNIQVQTNTSVLHRATQIVLGAFLTSGMVALLPTQAEAQDWPMFGQNVANTANNSAESKISAVTASKLALKWTFATGGNVSARAAAVNGVIYFPDFAGNLWAVNAATGQKVWSHQLTDYGLPAGTYSRTTPAVANGILYVGTILDGWLLAVDAATGALSWKAQPYPLGVAPRITASPTVYNGVVYVGIASNEEGEAASVPNYQCCSSRGALVAVNAANGTVKWRVYTVPVGASGGDIWGSNPVVDAARGTIYFTTGNNFSKQTDATYKACIAAGGTDASCLSIHNHVDAVVAVNLETGNTKWATRLLTWNQAGVIDGSDNTNESCHTAPYTNCPTPSGPDYDFASGPNEITYSTGTGTKTIIGAGQKSGLYYALDPDHGNLLWKTQVGPGSAAGGIMWGSATDGKQIYVSISNPNGVAYAAGKAGSWAALNPATGAIVWQTPDPNAAPDIGAISVANGVVYAPSMATAATAPTMFALNAANGKVLWKYAAGASVNAGATISNGIVFWGSGYKGAYTSSKKFYAFSLNGK